ADDRGGPAQPARRRSETAGLRHGEKDLQMIEAGGLRFHYSKFSNNLFHIIPVFEIGVLPKIQRISFLGLEGIPMSKPNVLIAFYSRSGVTEALANAIAEGARAAGAEVRLRRAREVVGPEVIAKNPDWARQAAALNAKYEAPTEADAEWADAIV